MNRCRLFLLVAVIGLSIPLVVSSAPAWEFSMDGAFTWEYEYRGQSGREGFFGPYDVDAGSGATFAGAAGTVTVAGGSLVPPGADTLVTTPGAATAYGPGYLAPLNFWLGFHMAGNDQAASTRGSSFASGSEGSWNTIYMNTNMQIRMNQAVRVRGRYYIGKWYTPGQPSSLGDLVASEYINYAAPGVQRSFSPGYWNTLWLTAELPWGIVAIGKRPSTWGTGLGWNGEDNRASESLAFVAPYGPFRVQVSLYPSRRGTSTGAYYNQDFDKNNMRLWDMVLPSVTYRSGPVDMGFLFNFVHRHTGGEGILNTPVNRQTANTYTDFDEVYGGVYIKYLNGRMFFNSEVDWDLPTTRNRRKVAGGAPAFNVRDTYREHWRFMAEGGILAGPSKVSVIYAWLAGPDRRNGAQIDRTGLNVDPGIRSNSWSNTGLFRPYSYLMVYSYGLGTHMNADTTNGTVEDASILATRLDYAVASNLNVYGSFFWADRTNKSGYGWGFIRPSTANPGQVVWADRNNPQNTAALIRNGSAYAPNIPDPNLGYEFGAGMDWKFLENFTMNFTFSYWKPGKWFSYACVDKALVNWDLAAGGPYGWGVYPDRNIDPVWGLELKLVGDF